MDKHHEPIIRDWTRNIAAIDTWLSHMRLEEVQALDDKDHGMVCRIIRVSADMKMLLLACQWGIVDMEELAPEIAAVVGATHLLARMFVLARTPAYMGEMKPALGSLEGAVQRLWKGNGRWPSGLYIGYTEIL